MTRHPGSVEFDHNPKHQRKREERPETDPTDPILEKADPQKDPGDRTIEPVEGIGMDTQETPQIEDEWGGAPARKPDAA